jgi:hypothetical protein
VVSSNNGGLSYDVASGHFQSLSNAIVLASPAFGPPHFFVTLSSGSSTSVDLFVDTSGNFVSNGGGVVVTGSFTFAGTTISGLTAADPLLKGTIDNFGADGPGPGTRTFNGLYTVTGGELSKAISLSGGGTLGPLFTLGALGGFILTAENTGSVGILGDFTSSFASGPRGVKGTVELVQTPEPGGLTLTLIAALCLGGCYHQRNRHVRPVPR